MGKMRLRRGHERSRDASRIVVASQGGGILSLRPRAIAVQEPPPSSRGGGVEGIQIVVALETGDAKVVDATTSGKVSVKFS